ncbi:hypothetical protein NsoK4_03045 [Nitrosopumilus sp. K4]|uniref:hypothetical protein n=1 Tax=Nitrosopumilus sp. K4 TaxID=2795383 RepID=UPI001BACA292|nr:hypothetical protein [Nitrosopumilus sp. K4]QUC65245.1 hypothetical protein NsoK4_03045 [Nitrosopumilus sp. K4]
MVIINEKTLDEILEYLENSIMNLSNQIKENAEFQNETSNIKDFLSEQFDIRLENMLQTKKSSIHHLESGMKNTVIQKKASVLEKI